MKRTPKVYLASSYSLAYCDPSHVGENGSRQFSLVCKTTSKKRLAEILQTSLHSLNYAGCRVASDRHAPAAKKFEMVYYEHPFCSGEWHEYWIPIRGTHPFINSARLIKDKHCGLYPCCSEQDGSYSPMKGWIILGWSRPPYIGSRKDAIVFEKTTPKDFEAGDYHEPGVYWAHGDSSKFFVYKN